MQSVFNLNAFTKTSRHYDFQRHKAALLSPIFCFLFLTALASLMFSLAIAERGLCVFGLLPRAWKSSCAALKRFKIFFGLGHLVHNDLAINTFLSVAIISFLLSIVKGLAEGGFVGVFKVRAGGEPTSKAGYF